ncbi:hypothetical protein RIF23_20305, partial [Lipingzhangella sp. LS1_29]
MRSTVSTSAKAVFVAVGAATFVGFGSAFASADVLDTAPAAPGPDGLVDAVTEPVSGAVGGDVSTPAGETPPVPEDA